MDVLLIAALIGIVVVSVGMHSLWDRFDSGGVEVWMLEVEGLDGVCQDYLDLIREMSSGSHDLETLHYLDSQRQVTHDQILAYLGLNRSHPLDMEKFARRYRNQ